MTKTSTRRDVYQEVTDKIIAELEAGRLPWLAPWKKYGSAGFAPGMPRNLSTGARYSGINVVLLWAAASAQGFGSQDWCTFKQAQRMGAMVRKGSKGTTVVYADRFIPKDERAKPAEDQRAVWFLKAYTVFNREQIDGLPSSDDVPAAPVATVDDWHPTVRALVDATGVELRLGGDRACYAPGPDIVAMPPLVAFDSRDDFDSTLLHELAHWTGHKSRLDRLTGAGFGSREYAREELVAEMSAAFSAAIIGNIEPTVRHADYIGSWLDVLRSDSRAIVQAASKASKATDWLLAHLPAAEAADLADVDNDGDRVAEQPAEAPAPQPEAACEPGVDGLPQTVLGGVAPRPMPAAAAQLSLL